MAVPEIRKMHIFSNWAAFPALKYVLAKPKPYRKPFPHTSVRGDSIVHPEEWEAWRKRKNGIYLLQSGFAQIFWLCWFPFVRKTVPFFYTGSSKNLPLVNYMRKQRHPPSLLYWVSGKSSAEHLVTPAFRSDSCTAAWSTINFPCRQWALRRHLSEAARTTGTFG